MTPVKFRTKRQRSPFDSLLSELLNTDIGQTFGMNDVQQLSPKVNIKEREKDFQIEMLVPGLSKKEIEISLDERILSVVAKTAQQPIADDEKFTRKEFALGEFTRRFTLPEEVVEDSIKAEFKNGILTIKIPRAEKEQKVIRKININ